MEKGIEIAIFRPQYADGMVRCFQAVIGEGYPIKASMTPRHGEGVQGGHSIL
jgi:hypothetical protein